MISASVRYQGPPYIPDDVQMFAAVQKDKQFEVLAAKHLLKTGVRSRLCCHCGDSASVAAIYWHGELLQCTSPSGHPLV